MGTVPLTAPLRQRDFRLLWTGMSVSLLGDGFFLVAVAWEAFALSNQPAALAYVGVALSLPQAAMLLFGGAVSDRWGCRRVLIWADWARALAVGALAALLASGGLHLWELYVVAGLLGVAAAFASPAFDALVPRLVPEGELHQANAIEQFVRPATIQLAGPALGGLAVATIGSVGALAFDAMTFAFSALCMVRMTSHGPAPAPAGSDSGGIGRGRLPRAAVRPPSRLAVGDVSLGHVHLSVVHRAHSGVAPLRRAQHAAPECIGIRDRARRGWRGRAGRCGCHGTGT